jgi:phosphatidylinositol-bisphosphatase
VPVQFEFIRKLNDKSICKPWLKVEPSTGFVMPGDKSDIALEVNVTKRNAGALNAGQDQFYDILVLHLVGGKDIFITVSGDYCKSSFGSSINALVRLTVPIAELSSGALAELETKSAAAVYDPTSKTKDDDDPYPVPKELWFLCDLITCLGLDQEQLFLQQGLRSELIVIRDWLDTGLPVDRPKVSIHSAAESLLLFMESLREPVVPHAMHARCLEASANYLQCKHIASQLPEHHRHVFNYMTAFLREVIRHSAKNGIDPKILATLFASVFLREPPGMVFGAGIKAKTHQQLLDHKKARFVYHFLVNEPDD